MCTGLKITTSKFDFLTVLAGRRLPRLDALQLFRGEVLDALDQALVRLLRLDVVGRGQDVLLRRLNVLQVSRTAESFINQV